MSKLKASILYFLVALFPLLGTAATVTIPTASGSYIDWNDATISGSGSVENSGANIGSTKKNTVVTFDITNSVAQDYVLTFATGTKNAAKMKVVLTNSSDEVVLSKDVDIVNTGGWTPVTTSNFLISSLPAGSYTLTMKSNDDSNGGFFGNWGKLAFYTTDGYETIPGTINVDNGTYNGPKSSNGEVGYVKDGGSASYSFINTLAGVYTMSMDVTKYNDGTMDIVVKDADTGLDEVSQTYTISESATPASILLEGELTAGIKTMTFTFHAASGYICNYKSPTFTKTADHYARIASATVSGLETTTADDCDFFIQLPAACDATTTFSVDAHYGTVTATADGITVTDNGDGTFTLPSPAPGNTTAVTLTLTPADGAASGKTEYTLKLFRIGEISLTDVLVDGVSIDVVETINNTLTATYANVYTALPTVQVKVIDGTTVTAGTPTVSGTQATYPIHVEMAGKEKDYTLVVDGLHIYNKVEGDQTVKLKYTAAGRDIDTKVWSNGLYTLSPVGDGWENSGFKLSKNDGPTFTLTVPVDIQVKQFIIREFSDNYEAGTLEGVASDGATFYIPAKHDFTPGVKYDLIINVENHQAGEPIAFTFSGGSQTTGWYELTTEQVAVTSAPVLLSQSVTSTEHKNHCVVALGFDREMGAVTATIGTQTITAEGGSATLYFPVWNLDYNTDYTFTVAAGAATDSHGNANTETITIPVSVGAKATVEQKQFDYVVSNADELKAAIAAIDATNTSSTAERKVIFLKNGTYDLGGNAAASTVQWVNAHNISLVGESKEGVIICGTSRDISNPVLNIRYGSGQYMQDLTVRNLLDFDSQDRVGVSVAVYGGNKAIFKNVAMQAQQDTQVTGERAYHVGCDFYGAVDFLCGGGDNYYDQCNFYITNAGYITAPSTSTANKWGYVMQQCTINKYEGSYTYEADGNFSLGRPWQNEPRNYWLNTTMNVQPSAAGWGGMGTLPTHFYEYNSVDADGQAIDLSVRQNSPTSTNSYSPVLTAEQATAFTVENVLGGTDSWLPTEECVSLSAPTATISDMTLQWTAVDDARCYVVFKDGQYYANLTATTLALTETGDYTVCAANGCGGLGERSNSAVASVATTTLGWATACLPYDAVVPDDTKAYYVSDVTSEAVVLTELTEIPAGEGFIYNATEGSHAFAKATTAPAAISNKLVGTLTELTGITESSIYVLGQTSDSKAALMLYTGTTLPAGKAYLPATSVPSTARSLRMVIAGETTAVSGVATMSQQPAQTYDLQGRRVIQPTKGIYVKDGKKIIR